MKLFVLLLACIGPAISLVPGNQYVYQYEGRLGIGMPEIRNRLSGTGIKATVDIQVESVTKTIFKMRDIQVGQFLGDVPCDFLMPIQYSPISGDGKLLEEAFIVNFKKEQDGVLVVSKSDIEWITNLRKSVVGLFLIEPVRSNFGPIPRQNSIAAALQSRTQEPPEAFSTREPSIHGYCTSDYTLVPTGFIPVRPQQKTRAEAGQPYVLSRTINFNQCSAKVELQQAGIGNTSQITENQYGDIASRFSVMTAYLTKEEDKYTLHSGSVEGTYSTNPLGIQQDKLRSTSNQTFELKSVQKMQTPFPLPPSTKSVRSWNMAVASPYQRAQHSPQWVNFYAKSDPQHNPTLVESMATGIPITTELIQQFKTTLDTLLDQTAANMLAVGSEVPTNISVVGTDEAKIVTKLESAHRLTRGIDTQNLEQLFNQYYNDQSERGQMKLKLLIDVCAAAGAGPTVSLLLSEIKKGRITPQRTASIFFTYANNFIVPPNVPEVTEYVKTLDVTKNPILASTVYINYANTLNRICLNPHKYDYTNPAGLYGTQLCQPKQVIDSILPFFQSQFQKAQGVYERIVVVHAMGNLGTSEVLSTLGNIIRGRDASQVRAAAIYSLTNMKVPSELRQQVFNILMPVVINQLEQSYLRQAAVASLLTWRPATSWYQQMAVSTWNEKSDDMAAFIYFLLQGQSEIKDPAYAREAKICQFVLPLAKPYSPSMRYTYALFWGKFVPRSFVGSVFDAGMFKSEETPLPRNLFSLAVLSFGGLRYSAFQTAYGQEMTGASLSKFLRTDHGLPQAWKPIIRSATNRRQTHEAFEELKNRMEPRPSSNVNKYSNVYLNLFDNLELIVPLLDGPSSGFIGQDVDRVLRDLSEGKQLHMTKFMNPAPIEVVIPTEIGLPLIAKVSVPTVNGGEGEGILKADGEKCTSIVQLLNANQVTLNVTTNYKLATKTLSTLRVIMPWSRKVVGSGVETMKSVNLPMTYKLQVTRGHIQNVSLGLIPTYSQAFPMVHAHTVPFVVIKQMWPGEQPGEFEKFEVISIRKDDTPVYKRVVPVDKAYTGVEAELRWQGDVPFPFTAGNVMGCYDHPERLQELFTSPSNRMWSTTFVPNFGDSSTKEFHTSLSYTPKIMRRDAVRRENKPMFEGLHSRDSQDGGYSILGTLLLNGTQNRYFESNLQVAYQEHTRQTLNAYIGRSALPGYDPSPSVYCLDSRFSIPLINSLEALQRYLSSQVTITGSIDLKGGQNCQQRQFAHVDLEATVSDQRRKMLQKDLQAECNSDPADPMVSFTTAPVYDEVSIKMDYQNNLPKPLQNASYAAYDIIRGWAFPHAYFNYLDVQNPSQQIQVRGNRYVEDGRWTMRAQLPTENVSFDHFQIPAFIQTIIPIGGLPDQPFTTLRLFSDSQTAQNQCVLTKSKVQTFDGQSFQYAPEDCPAYAVVNRDDSDAPVLLVGTEFRRNRYRAMVGSAGTGLTILATTKEVYVDGELLHLTQSPTTIKSASGAHFADARKVGQYVEIDVPGNFSIRLSDSQISVTPHQNMHSKSAGLCGSFSGSRANEKIGPKNCLYSDPKLFAYSWTVYSGAGCDYQHYKREHNEAKAFQKSCPKAQVEQTLKAPALDPIPQDCLEYVYKIRTRGGNICVTQRSIPMCYPVCKVVKDITNQEVFDCWVEEYAPKELKRNVKRGYVKSKVRGRPMVTTSFYVDHAFICSRK